MFSAGPLSQLSQEAFSNAVVFTTVSIRVQLTLRNNGAHYRNPGGC